MNVSALTTGKPPVPVTTAAGAPERATVSARVVGMATVVAWLGMVLALGLSAAILGRMALGASAPWQDDRRVAAIAIVLAVMQACLILALRVSRRERRPARAESTGDPPADLLHASRLAVVGQLSASIAHEINQPLGAILSNADAAAILLAAPEPDLVELRSIVADIRSDGLRASEVVRQVRTLARKRPPDFMELDLQDVCRQALHLCVPVANRRGVRILTRFDPQGLPVHGDPVLLRQMLLNLLLNALDALAGVHRSRAVVEVSATMRDEGGVVIVVRDHGYGIREQDLGRLFDTFFTTKEHGLGLGLPIVRSIIESHGGRITASNHPAGGAEFRITIPPAAAPDEACQPARALR